MLMAMNNTPSSENGLQERLAGLAPEEQQLLVMGSFFERILDLGEDPAREVQNPEEFETVEEEKAYFIGLDQWLDEDRARRGM